MRYLTFARCLLFTVLCIVSTKSKGRRPSVSKIMPVLELMEPEGAMYDPSPEDIDEGTLKNLLGNFFDSQVMSSEQPSAFTLSPNGTVKLNLKKTRSGQFVPQGPLPKHIKRMHLQFVKMAEGKRIHLKMGNKMRRRFRDLLWLQSYCPLLQKWKDLGPRFWPRFFLENSCAARQSCSFPRGMVCKPHKSVNKVLLRWHCQNWDQKKNCNWLKVQYPLVTECQCGC
ncbi:Noggin-2 like protein [Argiope bruennichi]|uniref:Noggin-2 like protein n=2 Tax=Argiope bruennichi TaxID=94029 RepID=A0A8T0E0F5_ARGBR|nr:Noggin-2 like protein [Argiope bruennichi]